MIEGWTQHEITQMKDLLIKANDIQMIQVVYPLFVDEIKRRMEREGFEDEARRWEKLRKI